MRDTYYVYLYNELLFRPILVLDQEGALSVRTLFISRYRFSIQGHSPSSRYNGVLLGISDAFSWNSLCNPRRDSDMLYYGSPLTDTRVLLVTVPASGEKNAFTHRSSSLYEKRRISPLMDILRVIPEGSTRS